MKRRKLLAALPLVALGSLPAVAEAKGPGLVAIVEGVSVPYTDSNGCPDSGCSSLPPSGVWLKVFTADMRAANLQPGQTVTIRT